MEHNGFLEPADDVYSQWGIGVYSKQAQEAIRKGDSSAARDHLSRAKSYHSKRDDYKRDAARFTK